MKLTDKQEKFLNEFRYDGALRSAWKQLWCLIFHKDYHTFYRDRDSLQHYFSIITCKKCNNTWRMK